MDVCICCGLESAEAALIGICVRCSAQHRNSMTGEIQPCAHQAAITF